MTHKRTRLWVTVTLFGILFVLSQDYWSWGGNLALWWFGLPRWVYTFAALQVGVSLAVAWHIRRDTGDR